jgi:hypothetical protein
MRRALIIAVCASIAAPAAAWAQVPPQTEVFEDEAPAVAQPPPADQPAPAAGEAAQPATQVAPVDVEPRKKKKLITKERVGSTAGGLALGAAGAAVAGPVGTIVGSLIGKSIGKAVMGGGKKKPAEAETELAQSPASPSARQDAAATAPPPPPPLPSEPAPSPDPLPAAEPALAETAEDDIAQEPLPDLPQPE